MRRESLISTPKRDEEHPRPFHRGVSPRNQLPNRILNSQNLKPQAEEGKEIILIPEAPEVISLQSPFVPLGYQYINI